MSINRYCIRRIVLVACDRLDGEILADLNTLRTHRHTWGRFVLSLFVVSWLSVWSQPCLMAMEAGAGLTEESGHSAHVMHDEDSDSQGADAGCGHCSPAACESAGFFDEGMSAGCQPDVQYSLDSRRSKLVYKDSQYDPPAGIAPSIAAPAIANQEIISSSVSFVSRIPGSRRPLNLLNCVYLI